MSAAVSFAVDLDVLADTRPLWDAWLRSARTVLEVDPDTLPPDRGDAATVLDGAGARNWRVLLERFGEDHAAVYLRRDAATSAALRSLAAQGGSVGVFTDAPEPLTKIALAQLGALRKVSAVETGAGALERLLEKLGPGAVVVRTRDDLLSRP
jgi:phosphoglycolate phosphatase-like HAD superfamily hydrolase